MRQLRPQAGTRLQAYDRLFSNTALSASQAHDLYSDPQVLADLESRLARVRATGLSEDVLTVSERQNFARNLEQLRVLEQEFFETWYLKAPMNLAMALQRWWTVRGSPEPQGESRAALIQRLQNSIDTNPLYKSWFQTLPSEYLSVEGPQTWGELLLKLSENVGFRKNFVREHPTALPFLKQLSQSWAWEDSSVRAVTVYNSGTNSEHWVLHRQPRPNVPNRFELILAGDMEGLIRLEYSPTLFFNRLSRIANNGSAITYYLSAIEKGRTMEWVHSINQNGTSKQTFRGAQLLRQLKADEFIQRDYIQRGSLHLFIGMRTLQLDQIQELYKIYPELILAVGQFGFSVTGGKAQTVSNRTDTPQEQIRKLTATLIDIIEFAKTDDVPNWFRQNTQHVLRTILGGVGAGGALALKDPTTTTQPPSRFLCRELF